MSSKTADLAPQARIRSAAITVFGRQGFEKTTVRQIAAAAGVSPGLVIHHFGSKDGLRRACDDYVIEVLRSEEAFLAAGGNLPALRDFTRTHPEFAGVVDYLVAGLRAGGATASRIFERLVELTDELFRVAEDEGVARLPADRDGAVALLVATSCGAMLLEDQLAARLGGSSLTDPDVMARYGRLSTILFTDGIFTPTYRDALLASLDSPSEERS